MVASLGLFGSLSLCPELHADGGKAKPFLEGDAFLTASSFVIESVHGVDLTVVHLAELAFGTCLGHDLVVEDSVLSLVQSSFSVGVDLIEVCSQHGLLLLSKCRIALELFALRHSSCFLRLCCVCFVESSGFSLHLDESSLHFCGEFGRSREVFHFDCFNLVRKVLIINLRCRALPFYRSLSFEWIIHVHH